MADEPRRKRPRITPRNSIANEEAAEAAKETPRVHLQNLASAISKPKPNTPQNRASAAATTATTTPRQIQIRTPGSAFLTSAATPATGVRGAAGISSRRTPQSALSRTPNTNNLRAAAGTRSALTRSAAKQQGPPTTPHAIRALQQRRNATPGRNYDRRRQSGRQVRETPRDDLRMLSRVLARKGGNNREEEEEEAKEAERRERERRRPRMSVGVHDDEGEGPLEPAPRMSMPLLADEEDDSWHLEPVPRMSVPLDGEEDFTVEVARRALLDDPRRRRRSTLQGLEMSGLAFEEEEEYAMAGAEGEQTLGLGDDDQDELTLDLDADGETGELRALVESRRRSRPSDEFDRIASPGTDGEPTFVFRIPAQRRRSTIIPPVELSAAAQDDSDAADDDQIKREDDPITTADGSTLNLALDAADDSDAYDQPLANPGASDSDSAPEDEDNEADQPIPQTTRSAALQAALARRQSDITAAAAAAAALPGKRPPGAPKAKGISKHSIEYAPLPSSVVKKIASKFLLSATGRGKVDGETLHALEQAGEWFFEQVADDLGAFAGHARRKTVEEGDVVTLMKRQKILTPSTTLFALASKFLPRELLKEIRMPNVSKGKVKGAKAGEKRKRLEAVEEGAE